ncbi:MAG: Fe-Mn family superoxide dismutase [Patescibacteria group bacterium UBA2163]
MKHYSAQQFSFGNLDGISQKQLDVHIKLYEGYVKHVNLLTEVQEDLKQDPEKNAYALAEVTRRLGFEWNGMRMHEHYFSQWEGEPTPLPDPIAALKDDIKRTASMRGIGWTLVSKDNTNENLFVHWVSDHELGQLNDTTTLLALDMWEHAFMVDYTPAEKAQYIDAWFNNLNGAIISERYNA